MHGGHKRNRFRLADVEAGEPDSEARPERIGGGAGQVFDFTVLTATTERLDALPHARLCITCKEKEGDGKRR